MKRLLLWLPLVGFVLLLAIFAKGLITPGERTVASGMVGKAIPEFNLPGALDSAAGLSTAHFADGKPRLLNIFASWCVPCVQEVPVLSSMKARGIEIDGIAIHDRTEDLQTFFRTNGNPYRLIGLDQNSRAQISFGSAGVPETFVVDGKGVIRHQHIGVVTPDDVPILLAKLEAVK